MPHASREREQPLPTSLFVNLIHQNLNGGLTNGHSKKNVLRTGGHSLPGRKILDLVSCDKQSLLALRRVCKAFKRWVSPLESYLFQKLNFLYPALVREKRFNRSESDALGILYGQILEKKSLDALFRIERFVTHIRLEIAPTGPSRLDPGTQLLDSLLLSPSLRELSIHLVPDDKCLPPSISSIAPRAVSNHLWTLPYIAPQDGHSPPPLSGPHPETLQKKDTQKTEHVSHAVPLLHLRASLARCRQRMHLFRSINFENLSIQGLHALSVSLEHSWSPSEINSIKNLWSSFSEMKICMVNWWSLPMEYWPFFEENDGAPPAPRAADHVSYRSREVNLKLRGWQVLTRWLRSIQNGVESLEFSWVEPHIKIPLDRRPSSPILDSPSSRADTMFSSILETKDLPHQPLTLSPSSPSNEKISQTQLLPEKKSNPEMSTRAAIESYAKPPVPVTPQLRWRINEGPVPLLLNGLKGLEDPLKWPAIHILELVNIYLGVEEVKELMATAPNLRTLIVSPGFVNEEKLPLLYSRPDSHGKMISSSDLGPSPSKDNQAFIDIPLFRSHLTSQKSRHKLHKRHSASISFPFSLTRSHSSSKPSTKTLSSSSSKDTAASELVRVDTGNRSLASSSNDTNNNPDITRVGTASPNNTSSAAVGTSPTRVATFPDPLNPSRGGSISASTINSDLDAGTSTSASAVPIPLAGAGAGTGSYRRPPPRLAATGAPTTGFADSNQALGLGLARIAEGQEGFGVTTTITAGGSGSTSVSSSSRKGGGGSKWKKLLFRGGGGGNSNKVDDSVGRRDEGAATATKGNRGDFRDVKDERGFLGLDEMVGEQVRREAEARRRQREKKLELSEWGMRMGHF